MFFRGTERAHIESGNGSLIFFAPGECYVQKSAAAGKEGWICMRVLTLGGVKLGDVFLLAIFDLETLDCIQAPGQGNTILIQGRVILVVSHNISGRSRAGSKRINFLLD